MPIDINFGALQQANPFSAYAQGQEIGQQNRLKQARQAAGNVFSTDPDKAAQILMGSGDYEGGVALRKIGREDRAEKARTAAVQLYTAGNVKGAQAAAAGAGDFDLSTAIGKMDDGQRARAKATAQELGGYAQTLLGEIQAGRMTSDQAKEHIQQDRAHLVQLGLSDQQIDAFDPSAQNLQQIVSQGMTLNEMLERGDKDRTYTETVRSHKASEANSAGQLAVSQGQLGVAQGGLGVRQQEFRERKAAGGFGTPGAAGIPSGFVLDN